MLESREGADLIERGEEEEYYKCVGMQTESALANSFASSWLMKLVQCR
jgi:hypothetical protein